MAIVVERGANRYLPKQALMQNRDKLRSHWTAQWDVIIGHWMRSGMVSLLAVTCNHAADSKFDHMMLICPDLYRFQACHTEHPVIYGV
jgi:hypothetical protein